MTTVLAVCDASGARIGELRALTARDAEDGATVEALTRWREQRGEWFLTRFRPTVERTRNWIANVVTTDPTRMLFLLTDDAGVAVGTIGLLHLDEDPIEVDNILRGERRGHRDLIFHALVAAIRHTFGGSPAKAVNLFVLSNNEKACALYRRLGFVDARRFALVHEERPDELRLNRGDEITTPTSEPHLLEMYLSRAKAP
jgi:RimJ/RimL family protein N-acetyltransferase